LFDISTPITTTVAMYLEDGSTDSDLRMTVAKQLLDNDSKELWRIAGLSAVQQSREMVKLESKIAKEVAKMATEKSKTSKAPSPPKPLSGASDPGIDKVSPTDPATADKMSHADWLAARNKQLSR